MRSRGHRVAIAALLVGGALAVAGCGDKKVNLDDSADVAEAAQVLSLECLGDDSLKSPDDPSPDDAIDTLVSKMRDDPDAIYQPGGKGEKRTMREVVADEASDIERCRPEYASELDRALDAEK